MNFKRLEELSPQTILAVLFLISFCSFLIVELFPALFYRTIDTSSYIVFHNVAEFFSIIVSFSIFGAGWYTYDRSRDRHILFLSAAFLGIGLLDFMHTLSYAGMPAFITPNSANKSTQFWIAARMFTAIAFLISAFIQPDSQSRWLTKLNLLIGVFAITGLVFVGIIFYPTYMPATFIENSGLTPFKVYAEYQIIFLFFISFALYWKRFVRTGNRLLIFYLSAFIFCIFSELAFAVYNSVFDTYNVLGHIYKVAAFVLIYGGIFITSVKRPYSMLQQETAERRHAEEVQLESIRRWQITFDAMNDAVCLLDKEHNIVSCNKSMENLLGRSSGDILGHKCYELVHGTSAPISECPVKRVLRSRYREVSILPVNGRWYSVSADPMLENDGALIGAVHIMTDITERKHVEESLTHLASLIESSDDAIIGKTLDGGIVSWNKGAEKLYGYSAEEVKSRNVSILVPQNRPNEVPEIFERIKRGERVEHYETVRLRKDGKHVSISLTVSPIKDANGKITGISTIARDVTERRKTEEAMARLTSILEATPDFVYTADPDGRVLYYNKGARMLRGIGEKEDISNIQVQDNYPEWANVLIRNEGIPAAIRDGLWRGETALVGKDGNEIPVSQLIIAHKSPDGKLEYISTFARDITESKRAEKQLRASSLYARSLIEASLDPLVTISKDGRIMDVNKATELVTGVPRERLTGSDFSDYFTEPEKARMGYQQVFSQGFVKDYPLAIHHISGKITEVFYNAAVYRNEAGEVQGVFAAARDITESKRAEKQLRASSLYARSLIEASLDPLVTINKEGKITDVNKATELVTGVSRERLTGSDFSDYFTEPEKAREGYQQVFFQGFVKDYPLAIRHASGKIIDVLYNAAVYRNEAGEVQGVFAAARDVTERRKMEGKLKEQAHQVTEAVNILAQSASDIFTATKDLASVAEETATAVSQISATAEEVKQTTQLSNEKAKNVSESSQKASLVAQQGHAAVAQNVEGINRIRQQMELVAESIVKLNEQNKAIGDIITTVNDLAEQSNLLAVNAAIEAAKAGEHGRGFAVVAQEIRSLAEQSKQATVQVRAILSDTQKATGAAVMAAEQVSKSVDEGVKKTTEAGESIRMLADSVAVAAQTSTQIAASSQEQLAGVNQIAQAMESIKQATQQNVAGIKQAEKVAQSLNELGQKLKAMVGVA